MPAPLAADYALPGYAQLSPQDEVSFLADTAGPGASWVFTADGTFIFVIVALFTQATTSGAAGTRVLAFAHRDANGNALTNVPGAAGQGPGTQNTYSASPQVSVASLVVATQLLPLPVIPLAAGMSFIVALSGAQVGDTFPAPMLTALRYSTEPVEDTSRFVSVPTPILL